MENWYYWSLEISNPLYIHDDTLTLLQRSVKNIIFFCKMKYFLKERNVGIFSKRITKLILLVRKIITQFFGSFVMFFLQCIRSSYVQNCNGLVLLLKCIEKIQKSGQIDVITSSPIPNKKKISVKSSWYRNRKITDSNQWRREKSWERKCWRH